MTTLLVDGANVVRRYAHALLGDGWDKPSDEDYLRVMEGAERAIRSCAQEADCGDMIIALDAEGETWRKRLYPDYKAQRPVGEFSWRQALARDFKANHWRCAEAFRFEADDVIATLVAEGGDYAILSSDSDLLVLADRATVYQFRRRDNALADNSPFGEGAEPRYVSRSPQWICEKYGLRTLAQLPLYKALVGEPGDNLPGVRGIGPRRAQALLAVYDGADDLFDSGKLSEEKCDQLDLMLELVTLRTDAPMQRCP